MSVHATVRGELPGLKALIKRMNDADRRVLVGVPVGAPDEPDGTPLATVAATHEFGYPEGNIPERSFLRGGIRRGIPKFNKVNMDSLRKVVRGEMTVAGATEKLGVVAVGEVKREFTAATFQPLKPATIDARKRKFGKKSTRPLIASGNLRQSITYVLDGKQSSKAKVIE